MNDYVSKQALIEFPYLPTSGTEDELREIAAKTMPSEVFLNHEDELIDFGWAVIEALINVIKTEEPANIREVAYGEWKMNFDNVGVCSECGKSSSKVPANGEPDFDYRFCPYCGASLAIESVYD